MLRAVLLGLLTLSAVSCKSHDESQAKSQSGTAAGKVIEVAGTVTLHHGTNARPLAKGEMVDADDEVETGADGSVVIEVQHNNVNWELGANKKGKMRDSLAWSQPKKDLSAKAAEQDSTAAGRHAERNAAESSATAAPAETEEMERNDQADEKKEAAPAKAAAPRSKGAPPAPEAEVAAAPAPAPTMAPKPPVAQPMAPPAASAAPGGGPAKAAAPAPKIAAATTAAPPPPPPPPKTISRSMAPNADVSGDLGGRIGNDEGGLGVSGAGEGGGGTGGGGGLGSIGTVGKGAGTGSAPTAQSLVNADKAKLEACLKSGSSMLVRIDVDASGKATVMFLDKRKWPDATKSCVKSAIDGITFPKKKSSVKLTIKA